jgi:hypothetical protein
LAERSPGFCPSKRFKWSQPVNSMSPPKEHPLFAFSWTSENISKASSAVLVNHIHHGFCVWRLILPVTLHGIQHFCCIHCFDTKKASSHALRSRSEYKLRTCVRFGVYWTYLLESMIQHKDMYHSGSPKFVRRKPGGSKDYWSPKTTKKPLGQTSEAEFLSNF